MKTKAILNLVLIMVLAIAATSCVSSKKYKSALAEQEALEAKLQAKRSCEAEKAEIAARLASSEAEMKKLKAVVDRNEKLIAKLLENINAELSGYDASDVKVEIRDGKAYITFSNKLLYQSGSAKIDEKGLVVIKKLSEIIKKNPEMDILIEGHTDTNPISTREFKDNWELSAERANNVVRSLVRMGVKGSKLTAAGRGEFLPVATNTTEAGRQLNRRTEVIIAPKLDELYELIKDPS